MNAQFWLIQAFNGVSYGALLFLIGSGLSLIFGVMRIVNLAHGSYFLLGGYIALSVIGAHRDPQKFPDPHELNLDRHPTGVLGFGQGIHYCIGAPLARSQIEVALTKLFERYPHIKLAVDPDSLEWENNALLRGLVELPVSLHG